ncbi:MAG: 50S ribosomal protein L6 [bacterium]
MSRLGKMPIELNSNTIAEVKGQVLTVKGPQGQLTQSFINLVQVVVADNQIRVTVTDPQIGKQRAYWGLYRSLFNNMVQGVNEGFTKQLEINGVGYKVAGGGHKLTFNLGYSHPIIFDLPEGITAEIAANIITLKGIDKQLVGEMAAQIRKLRKPEPYKGKGIKYVEEIIRRKAGKSAASGK